MKCGTCGAELAAGQWHCSKYANGQPTHDHELTRLGIRTFTPYVDEHISIDGKPVLITSEEQRRRLMNHQWQGDHQVKIAERHNREVDYRVRHWREYVEAKKH